MYRHRLTLRTTSELLSISKLIQAFMGRRDETFVIARFKLSVASVILIISVSFSKNLLRFTLLLTTDQDCSMRSSSGNPSCVDTGPSRPLWPSGSLGNVLSQFLCLPEAEKAPKIVVVLARVFGTMITALHINMEGRLIKKDTVFPKVHVSSLLFADPIKALLDPGFFQCQIALRPHESIESALRDLKSLKLLMQPLHRLFQHN
ncbi:hypothetical protein VTP01DRAFT_5420 [Rhizomucor pusillus]|uniref:uncharacterized protein n=1 Tax=Rhizomucor pusillus TaxID=4840 RepID=UPI003744743A